MEGILLQSSNIQWAFRLGAVLLWLEICSLQPSPRQAETLGPPGDP